MIPSDLTQSIKVSLKTATGQLGYILSKIDDEDQVENILLQLKAVQSTLTKTTYELLDDTYRKALAERISSAYQNCPGNCGNEETTVMPTKKGRAGSSQEKVEAIPLAPATSASTGVMQQSELKSAAIIPLVKSEFFIYFFISKKEWLCALPVTFSCSRRVFPPLSNHKDIPECLLKGS